MTDHRTLRHWSILAATAALYAGSLAAADPNPLIRAQKTVMVNGIAETWRLEWAAPPESVCGAEDVAAAQSCACAGYAYGEAGALSLVRRRPGAAVERLGLTSFYKSSALTDNRQLAIMQRWPPIPAAAHNEDDDWHHASDLNFLQRVQARGATDVMRIGDYSHDGNASEFLVQTDSHPCGTPTYVLVGVSRSNPHLHVFASAEDPDSPLQLGARVWEALRRNAGPLQMVETPCSDDTTSTESTVTVSVRHGVFHVRRDTRPCTPEGTNDEGH